MKLDLTMALEDGGYLTVNSSDDTRLILEVYKGETSIEVELNAIEAIILGKALMECEEE